MCQSLWRNGTSKNDGTERVCTVNKGIANNRKLWGSPSPQQIKSKMLEHSRMHSKNSTIKCDCVEICSWVRCNRGCCQQWLLGSFQQANDTDFAHHHSLCQLFFSLYSRAKNWLVSIHYWSHKSQDLGLKPGRREGEWVNALALANLTVFPGRQTIMGEDLSILVKVCPLECSQILTWTKENIVTGGWWTQAYLRGTLGTFQILTTLHEISLHRPSWEKQEGYELNLLTPPLSVMSCGISWEHTSGIFPNTIFMSEPERKSLTCKFTRKYFLYPKEDFPW